jgi:sortase A
VKPVSSCAQDRMRNEVIMKTKMKVIMAVMVCIIAFCVVGGILLLPADSTRKIGFENGVLEQDVDETKLINKPIPTDALICEDTPVSTPSPTASTESQTELSVAPVAESSAIASIKIRAGKKIGIYEIMEGVSEKTLEHSVGHLPSSALPGQEGICVLMGHRDTEFSILRYSKIGDEISIRIGGKEFVYAVNKIEIAENDTEFRFTAEEGKILVFVTCYPFRYSGHAPQKYVVYCEMIED